MLARSGDIQPNPGPSVKCTKRTINRTNKSSAKICNHCSTLTSFRRFSCASCGDLGESVCPYCISLNVINNHSESNTIREYNCNVCISNNSNVSVTNNNLLNNLVNPPRTPM